MRQSGSGNLRNLPKLLNKFTLASHPQRIHLGGHCCQSWQLRVNNTSFIRDQVFRKRMLTVTHRKGTPLDLPPLLLQLNLAEWIYVEIQHAPPRCFQTKALITGKVTTALEMPQHFMMPMCEHRDSLPAHPTVKIPCHVGSVRWSCHQEPAKLSCRVHFLLAESSLGHNFPAPFAGVFPISAGFRHLNSLWTLGWPLLQPF